MPTHEDYSPRPPTERHRAALAVADLVKGLGLAVNYGGACERDAAGRFYYVNVSRPPMDGIVRVFSPGYVTVAWRTSGEVCRRGLGAEGMFTYGSVEEALAFAKAAFVDLDVDLARAIPLREPKRRKAAAPPAGPQRPVDVTQDFFMADRGPDPGREAADPRDELGGLF